MHNPNLYYKGHEMALFMKSPVKTSDPRFPEEKDYFFSGMVKVVAISTAPLEKIPETIFYTDCGMSKEKALAMFNNMYKNYENYSPDQAFDLVVLEKVKEVKESTTNLNNQVKEA
jgi:hypothetical protein